MESEWVIECSSGYAGYRNKKTGEWLYVQEYNERISIKTIFIVVKDKRQFISFINKNYDLSKVAIDDLNDVGLSIAYPKSHEDLIESIKNVAIGWNAHYELITDFIYDGLSKDKK